MYLMHREQPVYFRSHLRLENLHLEQDWVDSLAAKAAGNPAPSCVGDRPDCATDDKDVD